MPGIKKKKNKKNFSRCCQLCMHSELPEKIVSLFDSEEEKRNATHSKCFF